MAKYTIDIKNAIAQELVDAYVDAYGYQAQTINPLTHEAENNPESAADFTKRKVVEAPKEVLKAYRAKIARQATQPAPVATDDITIS